MGAFFRRILAFVLGFVMSFATVIGVAAAASYWAYKNVKVGDVTSNDELPDTLADMTVEDFVADLRRYMEDPNSYSIGELEERYGVDLSDLLPGLDDDYKNINIFSLLTGDFDSLMRSVKLSVALGFLPEGTFSDNALEILGDHTLYDLVNGDQSLAQKLVGLFGKLKVGDILAFLFENRTGSGSSVPANGDFWLKDEYTDGGNNGALVSLGHLLGNLEIAALIRAFSPEYEEDILDEFMDGGLTDIADSRTIGQFLASLVPEDFPVDFEAMFGDKTIRDIITGKPYDYSINFGKLFGDITVADIFGAYTEDGVIYDRNGNPATGLLRDLADLNVGNILSALTGMITDGSKPSETLDAIVDYLLNYGVIDDLTVGSLFETLFGLTKDENGNWLDKNGNPLEGPLGALSGVFDLNIADLLDMIEEGDFSLDKLAELLDGMTLGDFLNPLLGFEKDESGNVVDHDGNAPSGLDALLAGVAGLSVPDILEAVDSLIKDGNIVPLLDALLGGQLGDVTVGDILGYTKGDDGVWRDADGNPVTGAVGKLLDFNLGDLYDTMTKEEDGEKVLAFDWAEMVDYLLSGVTLKDLIESLLPELYDQLAPELEARPSVEKLFDTPFGDILKSFLPDSITDVTDTLLDTNVADLLEVLGVVAEYFGAPADVIDTVVSEIKDIVGENSTFRNVFRNDITVGMIIGAIDAVLTAVAPSVAENNYYLGAIHPFELLSDTVVFTADPFAFTTDYLLNDLKKLLIADIANNLDETVTYFLGEGELTDKIGVVFDSIADLYEDADVEHFIDKTLDLNIHKIIDSVANITDAFVDLPEEMMTRVADILKRPFETWATLGNVDLNGRLTVTDATDTIEEALDVVEEYVDLSSVREYITNFLERVKAIRLLGSDTPFGDVMLKEVDPSVIMFIDTFEAIAGILTDFVPITKEYVDITTETVMTILDTETTTLTVYHLAEMVSVGNFISIFKEVFDLFLEEDNVIYDFLNPAKTVYGDVWVLKDAKFNENLLFDLIDATLAMNIHKFIDHVVDIVDKIATLPEGMAADIKEVVKSIFDPEATFGNVIFNGEITVGDITDDVRSIFDMLGSTAGLEMPEFVAYFLDHVDGIKLVSGEELRGIKIVEIDPSLIHLFDVIDVVAGTVKLAAPSVSDYIDVVVSLAEAIINRQQSTLTEIWLNDATTIHNIVEVVRDLLALFLEEDSVVYDILNPFDTVYGDIVIFSDTFVDDFVDATLGMNIHKFVDHVVAIADKMGILPEGVADRLASLLKRPFTSRATFGAVDIDGSLYVRDVTGMVDDLLFIITQFADLAPTSDYISQLLADVNNFGIVGGGVFGDVSVTSVDPSVILFIDVVKAITRFTDSVAPAASDYTVLIVEAVETVLNTERTTLTKYYFKKATTVADLTAIVRKLLGFFLEEDSIVFGVLDITDDLFGSVHYLVPSEFTDAAMGIEIFPTVRDVLALFGEDALPAEFYTVLDALENLYDPDGVATTVGSFVDDTLGLFIYDIIDTVTGLIDEFVDLPEGLVSDIGEVIKSIFDPEATVGNVIFNEGITVGQITDDIRTVLATAEAAGAVLPEDVKAAFNTFLDMTDDMTLVDGTKFADQVIAEIDPANIYIYGVIDILSATAKHLVEDKYVDVLVESIEDVILPNSTFADLQIDGSKTVGDVIGYINRIVLVYTQRNLGGVVGNLLGFIDDKFGDVRLAYFADDAYEAAKKLEIPTTLKDFLDVFGVRSEFEFYELFEKEDGTYLTVGDFIDDTDNALNTLMGHIEGIDQINDYLADLYFDKDFAELTDGEKAAIYGTYAAVAVGAIVCYFVFNDQIYDYFVTNDTRISDYVAPDSISDDPDLVKLLTELFDLRIASIMAFVHGRDGMDAPTFFREALDNIRIGDVVAAFTAVTEAGPYWTDNGRRFNVAFEMLFDVYFADPDARADLYGLIEGSAEITDVYDYEALAVIDGVGIVADIFTIVEGEIGELPNELSSKIVSVTDAVVRLIFVPESQLINPEFNVVSVRDLLVLTDSILAIFDLDDNAVYLAIRHPIDTIIGDAELLAINPFAFTPETIVDEFMGTQIDLFISEMCDMFGNLGLGPVQLYDEIKLALQKIFDGTMGEPEYNEDYSVHDITSSLTSVFRVAEEQDLLGVLGGYINIIYTVLDEIDNLAMAGDLNTFGQVKLIEIDRAADIKVRGIFSAVGEIVKSIELPVENETIDSVVGIVSAIFDEEATVSDWKITELKVSFFTDEIESILSLVESLAEGFTTPEAVTVFLTEIDEIDLTDGGKFGDVIVTEFDPSVIPYYYLEGEGTGVIDVVVDTVVTAVPEAEDYLNLAADLFKAVFRETSTLTKYYIKGGLTVSDILAVVNDGLALFLEEGNVAFGIVDILDGIYGPIEILSGTVGQDFIDATMAIEIFPTVRDVLDLFEEGFLPESIYTVVDALEALYDPEGDTVTTVGTFVDDTLNLKIHAAIDSVTGLVDDLAELPEGLMTDIADVLKSIFDKEAQFNNVLFNEGITVGEITDDIRSIFDAAYVTANFETPEFVTALLDGIDNIQTRGEAGTLLKDVEVASLDPSVIPYYYAHGGADGVLDVVSDTIITAVPDAKKYVELATKLFTIVFNDVTTLTYYEFNGDLLVKDIVYFIHDAIEVIVDKDFTPAVNKLLAVFVGTEEGVEDNGIYGGIKVFSETIGQDFIDATMAIEVFPTIREVVDLFVVPDAVYTVLDALQTLYDPEGDTITTVETFVDDTLNLKIHAAIDSVAGIIDDLAELPDGLMTDIADVLKSIFDKEAQFNNVIFNEDMTVGELTDDIRSILDTAYVTANFETPEFVTALLDGIDNIKTRGEAGTLLKDVAISALDPSVIPYYYAYGADLGVLDVLADVVTTAAPEAEKYVNIVVDVFSIIFNDVTTLTYYEFNGDLTVSDILAVVDDGLALFLAEDNVAFDIVEIVDGIYGEIRVFSDTLGQDFLEATKAIEIFPTVRDVLALFNEGTIPEAVYTVVDALEALYDPEGDTVTTVGSFVDDTLNLRIHAAIDSVAGIIDDLAEIPEGLMADIADVIKSIFDEEAQFNNVLFNSDITVGELTDDIRSILDAAYVTANFETPEFVTALLDGVDNVKTRDDAGTLLKDVQVSKLDPSVIPYYHEGEDLGVLDVVADTIITAAPAAEKYVNLVTRLFELIFRDTTTLTKYYVKSDLTINDAVYFIHDAVETIAGKDFTDAIDNIIAVFAGDESGENGGIYGDIRIVNSNILSDLLEATLDIEIFPTFDAVIANIDVPEQVTDISAILGVGGLYGATKVRDFIEVSRNLTITNVVRAAARTANVLGLLENEKVHNVAAGIADRVDELYGSSTVVEFASATANIYIKAFVQATFDILSIDFREIMPLALAGEGVTILDREVAVAASELIGYLFADSARFNHVRLSATALVTETVKQTVTLIEKIIDKKLFGSDSIGQLVLDFIYDNFGEVRYSHIAADARDAAAALEVYEIIDLIGGIADRIPAVPEGITASSVKLLKDLLKDSVVTEIGINEKATVGTLTDDVYGLVKAAASFENEKADGVVGSLSHLFANVRVLHFTEDFVNIEIADIGSAVNAIVEVFVTEGPVHRIITTLVDEFVLLVKEGATIGNFGFVDNITLGLINDALARVLFEKDMATLLAGEIQDKVKAYIIYYIDFNVGAILYMTARDLVTDILGDMTVNTEISIAGKTPEISYMIRDVKLNDILRATIDKFTGSVDRNGTMPFTQFLNTYFEGATVGDVIGVFLPEKIANKRGVQHVLDTLLLDVYRVIRHQIGKGEFLHIVLDGVVAGDFTNDKVLSFNGNQIGIFNYLNKIELNDLVAVTIPRIRPVSGYPLMSGTAFLKKYFTEEGGYITEFGLKDAAVKDLIGPFVPAVIGENVLASGNTVGEEVKGGLLNLSLYDIFLTVMGRMGKRALLYKALDGIRLGNVIGLTYTDGETTAYWAQSDGSPRIIYSPNEEELRYMDSVDYVLKALINDVLYTDLGKLVNPTPNLINQLKSGEASLGDVLDLEHEDGENGGRWYRPASAGNVYAIPLWNAVYNLKYTDLEGGVRKLILDRFGYLRVGEIFFDISFDETIGKWIYNPSDEVIFEDGKLISRIQKNLFKLRLEDITVDGQLSADRIMDHLFEDIYIGDAMGYHITSVRGLPQSADTATEITFAEVVAAYGAVSKEGEGFYKITDAATDLYYVEERNAAGETECYFLEFEDGRYVKKVMAVTDVRKIEYNELAPADYTVAMLGYVWTADGEPVDSVYSILANTRIDQVFGIGGDAGSIPLLDDIGWLAIADFDIDFGAESSILDKVADIPLCRIGDAMNDLYIGELIGYDMGEGITITEDAIGTEYTAVVTVTDDEAGTSEIVVVSKEIDGSTVYYKKHGDLWYKAILTESARRKTTYVAAYQRRESTEEAYTLNHLADYDFDWKDGGETLNGLSALMAGLSIFTILNEDFNTHIEWMGIKDVFTNPDFDNNILSAISDYPLCDIDNAINSLSIADVMGYKYASEALTEKPDGAETVVSASGSLPEVIKVADKYYKYVVRYEDGAHVWYEVDSSIADAKNAAAAKDPDASGKTEYDVTAADYTFRYKDGEGATAKDVQVLNALIADLTVANIGSGLSGVIDRIQWLTLKNVLGEGNSLFKGNTLFDIIGNKPIRSIGTEIDNISIGRLMDYHREGGVEIAESDIATIALTYKQVADHNGAAIAGVVVDEATNTYYRLDESDGKYYPADSKIADRKRADNEGKETEDLTAITADDYTFKYTDSDVSAVNKVIGSFTIGGVTDGNMMDTLLWLSPAELLGAGAAKNKVFEAVGEQPMCKIDQAINNVVIGDLMGYEYGTVNDLGAFTPIEDKKDESGKWYEKVKEGDSDPAVYTYNEVKGISAVMADLTIDGLGNGEFSEKVSSLSVADVIDFEPLPEGFNPDDPKTFEAAAGLSILSFVYAKNPDVQLEDLGTAIQQTVSTLTLGEMELIGMLDFGLRSGIRIADWSEEEEHNYGKGFAEGGWQNKYKQTEELRNGRPVYTYDEGEKGANFIQIYWPTRYLRYNDKITLDAVSAAKGGTARLGVQFPSDVSLGFKLDMLVFAFRRDHSASPSMYGKYYYQVIRADDSVVHSPETPCDDETCIRCHPDKSIVLTDTRNWGEFDARKKAIYEQIGGTYNRETYAATLAANEGLYELYDWRDLYISEFLGFFINDVFYATSHGSGNGYAWPTYAGIMEGTAITYDGAVDKYLQTPNQTADFFWGVNKEVKA